MAQTIAFIIPIRHPKNARNWALQKHFLIQTVNAIAAQDQAGWTAVVVANAGSDLPDLPANVHVKWVDFPPNQFHERGQTSEDTFKDAFRFDKGRRVLAGLLETVGYEYVMVVDDDDLVSNRLAGMVAARSGEAGWYFEKGYAWDDGGNVVYLLSDFSRICGSSHIVRREFLEVPEKFEHATPDYIKTVLGSHMSYAGQLAKFDRIMKPLPFPGAVYRVNHQGSHSQTPSVLRRFVFNRTTLANPAMLISRISNLRPVSRNIRAEFTLVPGRYTLATDSDAA